MARILFRADIWGGGLFQETGPA